MEQSQVSARRQEAGRREARSKSFNHRQNLSATWDRDSPSPPPPIITQEEMVQLKDKGLHAVARSKVITNPWTRSMLKKVKEVMTQGETQGVARSPSCKRVKANLKEWYAAPPPANGAKHGLVTLPPIISQLSATRPLNGPVGLGGPIRGQH